MKYVVVSGSHREKSQSEKISRWLMARLEDKGNEVETINLAGNPFPLWEESAWNEESDLSKLIKPSLDTLESADGIVIVSPEWAGMVPGGLKNFLLYLSSEEVGHKPVLLVGVSSSRGGAYPISELRMNSSKNNKMFFIPDHLIVRNAEEVMNDNSTSSEEKKDDYIKKRAIFSLEILEAYAKAMQEVRKNKSLWKEEFEYGM